MGGLFYGLAIYTIITDVTILVLPIPLLLGLNIKLAQKAGVLCLFLLGFFTTVCSIMRLTQIQRVGFGDGNSTMLILWGTIEFNVGVSGMTSFVRNIMADLSVLEHRHLHSIPGASTEGPRAGNRFDW